MLLSCDEVLERARKDGSIDVKDWSQHFDTILQKLYHNVHNLFVIPSIPDPIVPSATLDLPTGTPSKAAQTPTVDAALNPSSQISAAEDTLPNTPSPLHARPNAPVPQTPPAPPRSTPNVANSSQARSLPRPLLTTWNYVQRTLTTQFSKSPPHTVQRLAELILDPKQHYRLLPSYLNALDRVVSVSSGSNIFPLSTVDIPAHSSSVFVNGTTSSPNPPFTDGDESMGGALLTPIPWLRNGQDTRSTSGSASAMSSPTATSSPTTRGSSMTGETHARVVAATTAAAAAAPNNPGITLTDSETDDGDIPMTSDDSDASSITASTGASPSSIPAGAVTQGELLRLEQEANGPPAAVASASNRQHILASHDPSHPPRADPHDLPMPDSAEHEDTHEQPHARGPEQIGLEDTGRVESDPVDHGIVLDMEAAVGRSHTHSHSHTHKPTSGNTSSESTSSALQTSQEHDPDIRADTSTHPDDSDIEQKQVDVDGRETSS